MDTQKEENAAVAVLPAPKEKRKPKKSPPKQKLAPNYHVILWNDDDHSPEYVIEMISKLFGYDFVQAHDIMWRVHNHGKAVTCTVHRELAELRREQISTYGPDITLSNVRKVSMRATLEEPPA